MTKTNTFAAELRELLSGLNKFCKVNDNGIEDYSNLVAEHETMKEEMEKAKEEAERIKTESAAEVEKSSAEMERIKEESAAEVEKIKTESAAEIENIKTESSAEVERIKEESKSEVDKIKEESNAEVERIKEEMAGLRTKQEEDLGELQQQTKMLKDHTDLLLKEFGDRYAEWDTAKRSHDGEREELARLRKELETTKTSAEKNGSDNRELRDKNDELMAKVRATMSSIKTLQEINSMRDLELKQATRKLEDYRHRNSRKRSQLGLIYLDGPKLQSDLLNLATGLHELMWDYFNHPVESLARIDVSGTEMMQIPQPTSNSPAALAMRCALAEALVAKELSERIFTDFPTDESNIPVAGLPGIYSWLDENHYKRESVVIRCQLAKILASHRDDKAYASRLAAKLCKLLGPWLGDREAQFTAALAERFEAALALWQTLQRAEQWVQAEASLVHGAWLYKEDRRARYDTVATDEDTQAASDTASQGRTTPSEGPLAVLFPQIYAGETLLYAGSGLFAGQPAVEEARQEARKQQQHPDHRTQRASLRRASHQYQLASAPPAKEGGRRMSLSPTDKSFMLSTLLGGGVGGAVAQSDLSSVLGPMSQIDGKGTELSAVESVRSQRSGSETPRA